MTCLRLCSLLVFGALLMPALPVPAQDAPSAAPPAAVQGGQAGGMRGPRGPRPAPTNLKVLPKTMTGDDVDKLMRQFTGELGVECEFCHAQNPTTHRNDFPSDANPAKDTARFMITMTADLNDQYLENLPGRQYADPITCGTCHRGASHPTVFVPKPRPRPAGPGGAPGPAPGPSPASPAAAQP